MYSHVTKVVLIASLFNASLIAAKPKKNEKMNEQSIKISELLTKRYSSRTFDPNKTVSQQQIQALVEAARQAPSSYNDQPWFFIICDKQINPAAYEKVFNSLVEFNQNWVKDVSILIVVIASSNSHNNEWNRWAQYDTGAAAFSMVLQASALGLMTHQMGGFDETRLREAFNIPQDFVPMSVMAVGYAMPVKGALPKKERKSVEENFFYGEWKN